MNEENKKCFLLNLLLKLSSWSCTIFKIVIIASIFLLVMVWIQRSHVSEEKLKVYQSMGIFNKMYEIMYQRCIRMDQLGYACAKYLTGFEEVDIAFRNAKNLNEKFRITKDIEGLINEQGRLLDKLGNQDLTEKEIYRQLQESFDKIK